MADELTHTISNRKVMVGGQAYLIVLLSCPVRVDGTLETYIEECTWCTVKCEGHVRESWGEVRNMDDDAEHMALINGALHTSFVATEFPGR